MSAGHCLVLSSGKNHCLALGSFVPGLCVDQGLADTLGDLLRVLEFSLCTGVSSLAFYLGKANCPNDSVLSGAQFREFSGLCLIASLTVVPGNSPEPHVDSSRALFIGFGFSGITAFHCLMYGVLETSVLLLCCCCCR